MIYKKGLQHLNVGRQVLQRSGLDLALFHIVNNDLEVKRNNRLKSIDYSEGVINIQTKWKEIRNIHGRQNKLHPVNEHPISVLVCKLLVKQHEVGI